MGSAETVQTVLNYVGIWACLIVTVGFAIQYTMLANWWRNPTGIFLIALDAALFLVRFPRALEILSGKDVVVDGATAEPDWLSTIGDLIIPAIILARMITWEILRRRQRRAVLESAETDQKLVYCPVAQGCQRRVEALVDELMNDLDDLGQRTDHPGPGDAAPMA